VKILATFDGTKASEATIPILQRMAALPNAEFLLMRIAHEPSGRRMRGVRKTYTAVSGLVLTPAVVETPQARYAETVDQAIDRVLRETEEYLSGIAAQLGGGAPVHVEAHIADKPGEAIIEEARREEPAVIVMAMRGRSAIAKALFGSTTEQVLASGVAPVLVVHPPAE